MYILIHVVNLSFIRNLFIQVLSQFYLVIHTLTYPSTILEINVFFTGYVSVMRLFPAEYGNNHYRTVSDLKFSCDSNLRNYQLSIGIY